MRPTAHPSAPNQPVGLGGVAIRKAGPNAVAAFLDIDQTMPEMQLPRRAFAQGLRQHGMQVGAVHLSADIGLAVIRQALAMVQRPAEHAPGAVMEERKPGGRAGKRRDCVHQAQRPEDVLRSAAEREAGTDFAKRPRLFVHLDREAPIQQRQGRHQPAQAGADDQDARAAHDMVMIWRTAWPLSRRSKPALISFRPSRPLTRRSTGRMPRRCMAI